MNDLGPYSSLERLFVDGADRRLPVGEARIERRENGALCYFWASPCAEVEGLWVLIEEQQISLFNKITHSHIGRYDMLPEIAPDDVEDKHIVDRTIADIERILAGQTAFSISYDIDGLQHSSGMGRLATMADEIARYREVFGEAISRRTWTWFGEVTEGEAAS